MISVRQTNDLDYCESVLRRSDVLPFSHDDNSPDPAVQRLQSYISPKSVLMEVTQDGERKGFIMLVPMGAGDWIVHSAMLLRGKPAVEAAIEAKRLAKEWLGARRIFAIVPNDPGHKRVFAMIRAIGGAYELPISIGCWSKNGTTHPNRCFVWRN